MSINIFHVYIEDECIVPVFSIFIYSAHYLHGLHALMKGMHVALCVRNMYDGHSY